MGNGPTDMEKKRLLDEDEDYDEADDLISSTIGARSTHASSSFRRTTI